LHLGKIRRTLTASTASNKFGGLLFLPFEELHTYGDSAYPLESMLVSIFLIASTWRARGMRGRLMADR